MLKILQNYIREQKKSLFQVIMLGILVIIMITPFLTINFATSYFLNDYVDNIVQNKWHQKIQFWPELGFEPDGLLPWEQSWLQNMHYLDDSEGYPPIKDIMERATFRLDQKEDYNASTSNYTYRFWFYLPADNIFCGEQFHDTYLKQKNISKQYIDFKLFSPINYRDDEGLDQSSYLSYVANKLNKYVYDRYDSEPVDNNNKTNFFIVSENALTMYNNDIKDFIPGADKTYNLNDIKDQSYFYNYLIMGSLYGNNIQYNTSGLLSDLILSGQTLYFKETRPTDEISPPVIVRNGGESLKIKPLEDDEILIFKNFAQKNNLKVGDKYRFFNYEFKIRGFITSSSTVSPAYYFSGAAIDEKNQTVAYVNTNTINKIIKNPYFNASDSYLEAYNPDEGSSKISPSINPNWNINNHWFYDFLHERSNANSKLINGIDERYILTPIDSGWRNNNFESSSYNTIVQISDLLGQLSYTFISLIFIITTFVILIITFKLIRENQRTIGILKASGYSNNKISFGLILGVLTPTIAFGIIAAALAFPFSHWMINLFSSEYILYDYGWTFNWSLAILTLLFVILAIFVISIFIVRFLIRHRPLNLINNNFPKKQQMISIKKILFYFWEEFFSKVSYKNKLAFKTMFRSFGRTTLIMFISMASTILLLFSFSTSGLINTMIGLRFSSVNYNYLSEFNFSQEVQDNFIPSQDSAELLYKIKEVSDIKTGNSLRNELLAQVNAYINDPNSPHIVNFRSGYLMGSDLFFVRQNIINPNWNKLSPEFHALWNEYLPFIDYITNNNGQNQKDLMLTFGLLPYLKNYETPYTTISDTNGYAIDDSMIDPTKLHYNNMTNLLEGSFTDYEDYQKQILGVTDDSRNYLNTDLSNSNLTDFSDLTLAKMTTSKWWLDKTFINKRNDLIKSLGILNPKTASVQFVPIVAPRLAKQIDGLPDAHNIGSTILYDYGNNMDHKKTYIVGIVYDTSSQLLDSNILVPQNWINQILMNRQDDSLTTQFSNSKFSKLKDGELQNYLSIISKKNDYNIDLTQIVNDPSYLQNKGVAPGLSLPIDINSIKQILQKTQYGIQTMIIAFTTFSIVLSLLIVAVINNIQLRDSMNLANTLKSLGYSNVELAYIFFITTLPIIFITGLFGIFIAPVMIAFAAGLLSQFLNLPVIIFMRWWYYVFAFFLPLAMYLFSYFVNSKLVFISKALTNLTK